MPIKVNVFTFNALQENTYIVSDETKECVIIDPGCADKAERQDLEFFIKQNNLKPVHLLNTHCHIDHVLGNAFVKQTYKLKLSIHPVETETLRSVKLYAAMYGYPNYEETEAEIFVQEGEKITFGNSVLDILFVPGHAPGHIAFVDFASKQVFAGDVIFKQSIGRTDLPGGNFKQLEHSIRTKLYALADDFVVYCGHGPKTTIGMEKKMGYFRV